uniref:Molybdenum cofactor guanylyltransferase n=1 Tax=Solibacter usitatus (strain Ellin6076) TaxID=234267 RepID=Q01XR8_SOLUE
MGRDKALLPFHGAPLAEAVARRVEEAAGSVTIVGHPALGGIGDRYPGEGPLGGILTALHHTSAEWNLIVACDMPQVSAGLLRRLLSIAAVSPALVILPHGPEGRPEPLCAVYSTRALPALEAAFAGGIRKVTTALAELPVERLDISEVADFQNVNTPEDWSAYAAE